MTMPRPERPHSVHHPDQPRSAPRAATRRTHLLRAAAAVALGLAAALLLACGSSTKGLIPAADAGPLQTDFETVQSAAENGDGSCAATEQALSKTSEDFSALPSSVDAGLRSNLSQGIRALRTRALALCAQPLPQTNTATEAKTTPTNTPPTETKTTPTVATPTETTPTTPTTPTEAPHGGTPAPGETPGAGPGGGTGAGEAGSGENGAGGGGAPGGGGAAGGAASGEAGAGAGQEGAK